MTEFRWVAWVLLAFWAFAIFHAEWFTGAWMAWGVVWVELHVYWERDTLDALADGMEKGLSEVKK